MFRNAGNQTKGCCVSSKYATTVLCSHPDVVILVAAVALRDDVGVVYVGASRQPADDAAAQRRLHRRQAASHDDVAQRHQEGKRSTEKNRTFGQSRRVEQVLETLVSSQNRHQVTS